MSLEKKIHLFGLPTIYGGLFAGLAAVVHGNESVILFVYGASVAGLFAVTFLPGLVARRPARELNSSDQRTYLWRGAPMHGGNEEAGWNRQATLSKRG